MLAKEPSMVLVQRARDGDRVALDELCRRYLPRLSRWAHGRLPSWARGAVDTQDLVQAALAQAAHNIEGFEPRHEGAFQAYVRQALMNKLRDELRRAERRGQQVELTRERPSPAASPLDEAIGGELLERYEMALARLQPSDRAAIIARVEMGLSWSEVADALEKNSAGAAQMTVSRALLKLAKEMSNGRQQR